MEVSVFETSVQVARILKSNKVNTQDLPGKVLEDIVEQQVVWYPNSGQHPATH